MAALRGGAVSYERGNPVERYPHVWVTPHNKTRPKVAGAGTKVVLKLV